MLVKVKDPSRVYFDREQGQTFNGKATFETKVTYTIRQLLNDGKLVEVEAPQVTPQVTPAVGAPAVGAPGATPQKTPEVTPKVTVKKIVPKILKD